ncbi:hypothetical protein BOX15_Mlig033632g1 [Macrostomum lignano]|nr:hypothetical protein BOX15_Mlig033632g1 [Macrostomum lignano]
MTSRNGSSGGSCWGLAALARRLHSPDLVASFQAACGVEFLHSNGPSNDGTDSGVSSTPPQQEVDASAPGADEISLSSSDRDSEDSGFAAVPNNHQDVASAAAEKLRAESESRLIDSTMQNHVQFRIRSRLLYSLFVFGAALGNEEFYLTFFPYWFWNVDGYAGRRVLIVWAASMYVGQALKEIMQIPRPASPPVAKQEKRYELEYGFPSTHATIGVAIPFALFFLTQERYLYSWSLGLAVCICWSMLVCLSRIYLGMHSFLDVIAGALLGVIFLVVLYPYLDRLDRLVLTNPNTGWALPSLLILLCLAYPSMQRWNTARGDSTTILAGLCGIYVGAWLAYQHNMYDRPKLPPPYQVKFPPDLEFFGTSAVRMALGGTLLMAIRAVSKFAFYRGLCRLYGLDFSDAKNAQLLKVELPYKFATYTLVSFSVTYVSPLLFRGIGIHRIVEFTDLDPD